MPARRRLPTRRASTTFSFDCGPHRYLATISYFPGTNQLAEIFLGKGRAGSGVDAAAKDSAIVPSIAFNITCRSKRSGAHFYATAKAAQARRSAALDLIAECKP